MRKLIDQISMTTFGISGIVFFILSAYAFSKMKDKCTDPIIYDGLNIIMVLGAIFFTIAIAYMFCNLSRNCYTTNSDDNLLVNIYISTSSIISLFMIILLSIMLAKLNKAPECLGVNGVEDSDGKQFKFSIIMMLILSIIVFIVSGVGNYYIVYGFPTQLAGVEKIKETKKPSYSYGDSFASPWSLD